MTQVQRISNLPAKPLTGPPIAGIAYNILKTLTDPLVKDITDEELFMHCKKAVLKAYADTGFKVPGEDVEQQQSELMYMINSLASDIRTYHPTLRPKEIEIAISRGVRKEYGQYMGLNPVVFSDFMKAYKDDPEQVKARQEFHKLPEKQEPTEEEKQDLLKSCILNAFEDYKKNGWFEDYGNTVGKAMKKLGLFSFTEQEIAGFKVDAVTSLKKKHMPCYAKTKEQKQAYNSVLARLEAKKNEELSQDMLVRIEASKLAVNEFFKRLAAAGKQIEFNSGL